MHRSPRVSRITALTLALLLGVPPAVARAQETTGKIQGRVVNAQTGEPLPGAQVIVVGTQFGNLTNQEGYYFINNVPAGVHDIQVQLIGYQSVTVAGQRVLAGQTMTVNFELTPSAIEIQGLVIEGERNPLVPRDQVSSRTIVTGEEIDRLPLDNTSSIVLLQPGVISTNRGRTIRGSRVGEEAVLIDGVPVRRMRTGDTETVELPTNALAQVDVTTGGFSARYGDAMSGVINYVTRTGSQTFGGTLSFMTEDLAPNLWRTGFNRAELTLSGPIPLLNNLTFFVGGTFEGRRYGARNQGFGDVGYYVATGIDTVFRLPRTSSAAGATDSVDVVVPKFVKWPLGVRMPTSQSDEINLVSKVSLGLARGSRIDLSYYWNRDQSLSRGSTSIYNPLSWNGSFDRRDMVVLGGYFMLSQSADQQLSLDVRASYQDDWFQEGDVSPAWLHDNLYAPFGFRFSNIKFLLDPDDWPVTRELVEIARSGLLPAESLQALPGRGDLAARQGVFGVSQALRLNPYGMRSNWSTFGTGNTAQSYGREKRWYASVTLDWQINRFNRLQFGGSYQRADTRAQNVPLYSGRATPVMFEPTLAGLFAQHRLDIGDVVLEGGLRFDYYDPSGELPRVPGFVYNVPDSLKKDFVRIREGDGPLTSRIERPGDCGGEATLPNRINPVTGEAVCKPNFIKAKTRTSLSPRLAVSFPVTATSNFRLSYAQNTQTPFLNGTGGLFQNAYNDQYGGNANTNTTYGRDVEIPRTVLYEAGYRQMFSDATVVDVAVYQKQTRNALTYRKIPVENLVTGSLTYINALTNADFTIASGVDVRLIRRFGSLADLTLTYSYVNARGTGSDPTTYTGLILRRNTNLSILTGRPVDPPEVLMTLDQNRPHNFAGTFSLLLPPDFAQGSTLNKLLGDVGLYATMALRDGLPYTLLQNDGAGQTGPPTQAGLGGIPVEALNASKTPWYKSFDVRMTKGFRLAGETRGRLFVDLRNPLGLENTSSVWLETGTVVNDVHRRNWLDAHLRDATLDGDPEIDDFVIMTESSDNPLNKYMLLQAEKRFGNGDGVFTVEEQLAAFGAAYEFSNGAWAFRNKNRYMRLGFEIEF